MSHKIPKFIAFYLPQFHPIPENDLWWGKGFTEWTNVTKAKPLFDGHYQPHLPRDLGFYDLRLRETRHHQIELAKKYGIDGFCYHYYWFNGKRLLNKPIDDMLLDKKSNMPFCLCWANENWTRKWNAAEKDILIAQKYNQGDDLKFIKSLLPFLKDKRYIKVDGKPIIIIYRPQHLPNPNKIIGNWRKYCRKVGIGDIHICAALTHGNMEYEKFCCDSGLEFPPHNLNNIRNKNYKINFNEAFFGNVIEFSDLVKEYTNRLYNSPTIFKAVLPSWDNAARVNSRALIIDNVTPTLYNDWLLKIIKKIKNKKICNELIFINAWNEWAEGCHLEPDQKNGKAFLEATLCAKKNKKYFYKNTDKFPILKNNLDQKNFFQDLSGLILKHLAKKVGSFKMFVNQFPWLRNLFILFFKKIR